MNTIKELLDDKKKRVIAIVVAVGIVMIGGVGVYALSQSPKGLLKAVKEVIVEYGDQVSKEAKEYIDTKDLTKDEKAKVLKNTKVNIKDLKNEDEKDYPKIGEYEVTLVYEKEAMITKVVVKDTIAPVFNEINEISILQDTTDFAYNEYITAEDLQEITYDFKTDSIDVNTVGEYTMSVVATDKSGNESKKDIKVIILEKPTEESEVEIVTDPDTGKVTTKVTTKETSNTDNSSSNTTSSNNNSNSSNNTSSSNTNSNGSTNNNNSSNGTNSSNNTNSNNSNNSNSSGSAFTLPKDTAEYKYFLTEKDMNDHVKTISGDVWFMCGNFVDPTTGTTYYYIHFND